VARLREAAHRPAAPPLLTDTIRTELQRALTQILEVQLEPAKEKQEGPIATVI